MRPHDLNTDRDSPKLHEGGRPLDGLKVPSRGYTDCAAIAEHLQDPESKKWEPILDLYNVKKGRVVEPDAFLKKFEPLKCFTEPTLRMVRELQSHGVSVGLYSVYGTDPKISLPVIFARNPFRSETLPHERESVESKSQVRGCILDGEAFNSRRLVKEYKRLISKRAEMLKDRVARGVAADVDTEDNHRLNEAEHLCHVNAALVGVLLQRSPPETNFKVFKEAFGTLKEYGLPDVVCRAKDSSGVELMVKPRKLYFNTYYPDPEKPDPLLRYERAIERFKAFLERHCGGEAVVSSDSFQIAHRWEGEQHQALVITAPSTEFMRAIGALRLFLTQEEEIMKCRVLSPRMLG